MKDTFDEGDSPFNFSWISSTLNKRTNNDKLQLLSLLSAVSSVTESVVPGHVTRTAIFTIENESIYTKNETRGNAIASFLPLSSEVNCLRLVTLFAIRDISQRTLFSLSTFHETSYTKTLIVCADRYTSSIRDSIVSVLDLNTIPSYDSNHKIWKQSTTIDKLKSLCETFSMNSNPTVLLQQVTKSLQTTIEEGVRQIQEAKEIAIKSFSRVATGSHYQPPVRSTQKSPNTFSPTFFSKKSPSFKSQSQVIRPSVYGELHLLEGAAKRALDSFYSHIQQIDMSIQQIDMFALTNSIDDISTSLSNSSFLNQLNENFNPHESAKNLHWVVFSAALLYTRDSPTFLLAHTSKSAQSEDTIQNWSVLKSVEANLIARKDELQFAFKNSSSSTGLSFPVYLPKPITIESNMCASDSDNGEVNVSTIKHHGEEALLMSPFKYDLQVILHWRSVVSLSHSLALIESQNNTTTDICDNVVATLLVIASEKKDNKPEIDTILRQKFAHILLSTAGTLAANESIALLSRAAVMRPLLSTIIGEVF